MVDYSTFKHGGVSYPLPASVANPLLFDADPAMFYVLDYFASVLNTHLGARFAAEVARAPAMTGAFTAPVVAVCPYDPTPYLNEQQFRFPLLATYRKKDTWKWKSIAFFDDVGEWEIAYILPPMTGAQMERMAPFMRAVGVVLNSRIENTLDPNYRGGLPVWAAAGIEEIRLEEGAYGAFAGTGNLQFPAWRGKLTVKEVDSFGGSYANLQPLTYVGSTVMVRSSTLGTVLLSGLNFVATTSDFRSGFKMQITQLPMQVPVSTASPVNISETETAGLFFPGSLRLQVTGTFVATYLVEGSCDGVTWNDLTSNMVNMSTNTGITTITAPGLYALNVAAPPFVRLRCTAFTSNASVAATLAGII